MFRNYPLSNAVWVTPFVAIALAIISALMLWWKHDERIPSMISSLGVCVLIFPLLYPLGGLQAHSVYWVALMPLLGLFLLGKRWALLCAIASLLGLLGLYFAPSLGFPLPPPKKIPNGNLLVILIIYYLSTLSLGWLFESSRQEALRSLSASMAEAKEMALAKETAESVSKAKSAFLTRMSHELRTPLNAIIGYSESIDEDFALLSEQELQEDVQKIHRSGKHLLSLIEDLLSLAKIEEGKMALHFEAFALRSMISTIEQELGPKIAANHNQLTISYLDEDAGALPAQCFTDRHKLEECLVNLLDNAAKFTKEGQIHLIISQEGDHKEPMLHCRVKDTGVGITQAQQEHIFERFTQGDDSTTRRFEGSGLGLSLTKEFIEMLGGTIGVESEPGKGSTFWFRIPIQEPTQQVV